MQKLPIGLTLLTLVACGNSSTDDGSKAKLAGELVQCKNDNLSLKEQLGAAHRRGDGALHGADDGEVAFSRVSGRSRRLRAAGQFDRKIMRDVKKRVKELAAQLKSEPGSIPKRLELAAALREAGRPAE